MKQQHDDLRSRPEHPAWVAHILECAMAEFVADMERRLGLQVRPRHDHVGRTISYGYHWHQPDEQGICTNLVFYGYTTPWAALKVGLLAGMQTGITPFVQVQEAEVNDFAAVCQNDE